MDACRSGTGARLAGGGSQSRARGLPARSEYAEGWATLGFVLERTGARRLGRCGPAARGRRSSRTTGAITCVSRRGARGEERLRAARRTLALLPGVALAHWLAATVHVARQAPDEAERGLSEGARALSRAGDTRFSGVALEWLLGLICLARGDDAGAQRHFDRELAAEAGGHLYARECCASVWYANRCDAVASRRSSAVARGVRGGAAACARARAGVDRIRGSGARRPAATHAGRVRRPAAHDRRL